MQQELLSAAVVAAVGMWATLLRCPHAHSLGGDGIDNAVAPHRHRGRVAERLMGTLVVVEGDPRSDAEPGFAAVRIALEIDVFVFERAPQPLDEHVVHPAPAAIHRDLNAGLFERTGEGCAGELATLVGVEDLGLAEPPPRAPRHRTKRPSCWTIASSAPRGSPSP